jgi:hypothetical protein
MGMKMRAHIGDRVAFRIGVRPLPFVMNSLGGSTECRLNLDAVAKRPPTCFGRKLLSLFL